MDHAETFNNAPLSETETSREFPRSKEEYTSPFGDFQLSFLKRNMQMANAERNGKTYLLLFIFLQELKKKHYLFQQGTPRPDWTEKQETQTSTCAMHMFLLCRACRFRVCSCFSVFFSEGIFSSHFANILCMAPLLVQPRFQLLFSHVVSLCTDVNNNIAETEWTYPHFHPRFEEADGCCIFMRFFGKQSFSLDQSFVRNHAGSVDDDDVGACLCLC